MRPKQLGTSSLVTAPSSSPSLSLPLTSPALSPSALTSSLLTLLSLGYFMRYDEAIYFYLRAAVAYKACSKWRYAADILVKLAGVYAKLKNIAETAAIFTDAAETYAKVDKNESIMSYQKALAYYCDLGRFDVAGRLERKIAYTHFISKHWHEAALHYKNAGNFLSGEMLLDQSDYCFEKCAQCYIMVGRLAEAKSMFEMIAASCVHTNLRRFHARDYLMKATFCEIAKPLEIPDVEPDPLAGKVMVFNDRPIMNAINAGSEAKYGAVLELMDQYDKIDCMWRNSKEKQFIKNMIQIRLKWDEHAFADHVYYYNSVRALDMRTLICLKSISEELSDEVDRREQRLLRENSYKERITRRAERKEAQKKLNYEMGVAGPVVIEDDDEDKRLLAIVTGESFFGENPKYAKYYMQSFGFKARGKFKDEDEDGEEGEEEEKNDDESTQVVENQDDNEIEDLIEEEEEEEEEPAEANEEKKERKSRKGKSKKG